MTDEVAARSQPVGGHNLAAGEAFAEIATGGTLFANALSMAAGRAALTEVLTPQAFVLPAFTPVAAHNGAESRENDDADLRALMRLWMVNRGVWESGWWLGPTVSVAHDEADVDEYLTRFAELLDELTGSVE